MAGEGGLVGSLRFKEAPAKMDLLLWLFRVSQATAVTVLTATGQLSN